ncbi:MAG: MFS transporter [Saprospiraceae bacterium]
MSAISPSKFVLTIPAFRNFLIARLFMTFATNMLGTVVMWQVYVNTHDNLAVGMIGLAEFVPFVIVTLFAGYLADIFDRKTIIVSCIFLYSLCALALFFLSTHFSYILHSVGVVAIYVVNFTIGIIRGFLSPAQSAFSAQLVPKEYFTYSSNWLNMTWHIGSVGGPSAAGLVYALGGAGTAYSIIAGMVLFSLALMMQVPKQAMPQQAREAMFKSLRAGLHYVFNHQIMLGSITLDMFAVLFGGAVAMIPGFAAEVLHVGEIGAGFLRAAPAIGAIIMGIIMTKFPPGEKAGMNLLWAVFGFGVSTIIFGLSTNFALSFLALAFTGFFDNISMVIRGTIIQKYTPNEMRGRVSAVNSVFIGSSNELGAFESGVAARLMGLVPSVAFGGIMTLLVVSTIGKLAPKLKALDFTKE